MPMTVQHYLASTIADEGVCHTRLIQNRKAREILVVSRIVKSILKASVFMRLLLVVMY